MSKVKELKQENAVKTANSQPTPKVEDLMKEIFYLRQRLEEKTTYETLEWIKIAIEVLKSNVLTEDENAEITEKIRSVMINKTSEDTPTKS